MDDSTPETRVTVAPLDRLPLDLDDDPADESIYGTGYRARAGVVVAEPRPSGASDAPPSSTRR